MLINTPIPDFSLPDTSGTIHHLVDYRGRIVLLDFWSAECPWSERAEQNLRIALVGLPDVVLLPVASNLNETTEMINTAMQGRGLPIILRDNNCFLADLLGAQTTPHAFIIDQNGILRYQGAVDDVTFRKRIPEHFYVLEALAAMRSGRLPTVQEASPYGCTIVRSI